MRFQVKKVLIALIALDTVVASSWVGRAIYNKWHETELERWLSDHNVPFPTPADRKDLENLVKDHWNDKVVTPYNSWETPQLQKYLSQKGEEVKSGTEKSKDALLQQVKTSWTDTEDTLSEAYTSLWNWVFDTWSESQLKAFCDYHGIPAPQPRTRDSLLKTARENYQNIANKAGETAAYPGDWLFQTWSDSELKAWLDARGIPVYQGSKRNELISSVRRNSRSASNTLAAWSSSLASSAQAATQSVSDAVFDTWSDSQLKKWADERGVKVPQGSKHNELLALVRRHNALLNREAAKLSSSAASAYGAATSGAGNEYARATNDAALKIEHVQSVFYSYVDWAKSQVGLAGSTASASASSAYSQASRSASSASKSAAKSAQKAYDAATESAQRVRDRAKEEL
jgi:hypothetical protein